MYKKANLGWLKHWDFMILDLVCLQVAFISAYFIRHGVHLAYENKLYRNMAFVLFLIQVCVTFFGESFKNVLKRGYYKEFTATFKHVCQIILIAVFYLFATQTGEGYSRITLVLTGIIYAVISYIARILWKKYLKTKGVLGKSRNTSSTHSLQTYSSTFSKVATTGTSLILSPTRSASRRLIPLI